MCTIELCISILKRLNLQFQQVLTYCEKDPTKNDHYSAHTPINHISAHAVAYTYSHIA